MVPDKKLYSVLISAVGSADPQAVLTMQDHLLRENVVGSEVDLALALSKPFSACQESCHPHIELQHAIMHLPKDLASNNTSQAKFGTALICYQ